MLQTDFFDQISKNKRNLQVNEAVSHMFISDPKKSLMDNFFATHPPIEERIHILRAM